MARMVAIGVRELACVHRYARIGVDTGSESSGEMTGRKKEREDERAGGREQQRTA